ncbi:glycosyltransferase [Priestia koreensis]|uniref:glycosyltransferase n=1 Tax=Priestia koreensis TaxID=284581 RepID=UPI001F59F90F|nr:glycosyltransferase [Priestia koreensis]UNL86694.1 glycosyltransferase [Priestia koreensis]
MNNLISHIAKHIHSKEYSKAFDLLQVLQKNGPNSPELYLLTGIAYLEMSMVENAWLWFWRGHEQFPSNQALKKYVSLSKSTQEREWKIKQTLQSLHTTSSFNHKNEDLRVLQGSIEIANQMHTLAKGLHYHDVYAKTLNYYPYYLGYTSDYTWSLLDQKNTPSLNEKLRKLSQELCDQFDLFHFHFGTCLTWDASDIPILKNDNKKLLMHHWGSDARIGSLAKQTNPYVVVKNQDETGIRRNLARLGHSFQHCIVPDMELAQYVKDYYEHVHILPSSIDLTHYGLVEPKQNNKPLIVHAPTSPLVKGTSYITKAIEHLKLTYDFDFELIQGKSHEEAKKMYERADLIIDQLHIGSYGLLAVECMAMGKPVICWISDYMKEHYPDSLPIISANPDTITEIIKQCLENQDGLMGIGKQGRIYVEEHHDMIKNSATLLDLYTRIK